jgi:hypothetical protein
MKFALTAALSFAASIAQAETPQITTAQQQACLGDYQNFCPGVIPGGGRIIACLRNYEDKLSTACRAAVHAVDQKR